MSSIDIVVNIYKQMADDEKKELLMRLSEVAVADGTVKMPSPTTSSKGVSRGKRFKKPFWMKAVTGIDATKKGMFRVVGDWVNDLGKEVKKGGLYIVGFRNPKHYVLCQMGSESIKVQDETHTHYADALGTVIARGDSFKSIEDEVAKYI